MKAKAHSTEIGKNLSPNREEKNISVALAESRVLLSSCRATCTLTLPCLDKPHAKGKLEKRSRTHRQGKKKPPTTSLRRGPAEKGRACQPHQVCPDWEKHNQLHPGKRGGKSPQPGLWSRGRSSPQTHVAAPGQAGSCIPRLSEASISY